MLEKIYTLNDSIETNTFEDTIVVVCEHDQSMHVLNQTAKMILECLNGEISLSSVIKKLSEDFIDVDIDMLKNDIIETVKAFEDKGIIREVF